MKVSTGISRAAMVCLALLIAIALYAMSPGSARADDEGWVFRRSYFSHILPPAVQARYPIPESRSAYRRALVDVYPGFAVQGVQRYNTILLDNGNDVTIYRQFWVQFKP